MLKQVVTKYGVVEGVASEKGYALFRGIPYAASPTGELRWRPSIDPAPWSGVRKCGEWGAACVQSTPHTDPAAGYGKEFYASGDYPPRMSEDCLYLNIWTPAEASGQKLPVMVWLHGGGVQSGYSHEIEFDGDAICARGVILVTVNYRLNIFGYFAHPELSEESEYGASGNYGVHDQIQALRWVRDNIAAFGGDPENVTLFGQSGGGRSTQAVSCSPLAKGLLRRAIVQSSGGIQTAGGRQPLREMERRGVKFMEFASCKNVAELRAIPAEELLRLFEEFGEQAGGDIHERMRRGFNICTDGHVLPLSMEDTLVAGAHNDLDYMLGCTTGDSAMGSILASLAGWARLQQEHGRRPAYLYRFERELPDDDPADPRTLKGAFHSSELWYVFGTLGRCWRPMTAEDYALSEVMTDCWTNFAKTGDPNGGGPCGWTAYDDARPALMRFNVTSCGGCGMADADPDHTLGAQIDAIIDSLRR